MSRRRIRQLDQRRERRRGAASNWISSCDLVTEASRNETNFGLMAATDRVERWMSPAHRALVVRSQQTAAFDGGKND
jgi:hypothetical protein